MSTKKYRETHKERDKESQLLWRMKNKQKLKLKRKIYYVSHKTEITVSTKKYRETHKEKKSIADKKYRETHKNEIAAHKKAKYDEEVFGGRRKMKTKGFGLYSQGEEGAMMQIIVEVSRIGKVHSPTYSYRTQTKKQTKTPKSIIRAQDRAWVYHHIPSSIWWNNDMHHDWDNGGFLYFISPEVHKIKTRKEEKEKWKMKKKARNMLIV